jgi:hypothetical protein
MDRRDFIKTVLTTSLAAPLLIGQKMGQPTLGLYLISASPQKELPTLLDELNNLRLLRGRRFAFASAHPQQAALQAVLEARGWKEASPNKAELLINFAYLQQPARPSFTLIQDGRIRDLRSSRLYSLWQKMQAQPAVASLTVFSLLAAFVSPRPAKTLIARVRGEVIERLPLQRPTRRTVDTGSGRITFIVDAGQVKVVESTCRHRVCVASAAISLAGERIICAPNHFLLELEGDTWLDAVIG